MSEEVRQSHASMEAAGEVRGVAFLSSSPDHEVTPPHLAPLIHVATAYPSTAYQKADLSALNVLVAALRRVGPSGPAGPHSMHLAQAGEVLAQHGAQKKTLTLVKGDARLEWERGVGIRGGAAYIVRLRRPTAAAAAASSLPSPSPAAARAGGDLPSGGNSSSSSSSTADLGSSQGHRDEDPSLTTASQPGTSAFRSTRPDSSTAMAMRLESAMRALEAALRARGPSYPPGPFAMLVCQTGQFLKRAAASYKVKVIELIQNDSRFHVEVNSGGQHVVRLRRRREGPAAAASSSSLAAAAAGRSGGGSSQAADHHHPAGAPRGEALNSRSTTPHHQPGQAGPLPDEGSLRKAGSILEALLMKAGPGGRDGPYTLEASYTGITIKKLSGVQLNYLLEVDRRFEKVNLGDKVIVRHRAAYRPREASIPSHPSPTSSPPLPPPIPTPPMLPRPLRAVLDALEAALRKGDPTFGPCILDSNAAGRTMKQAWPQGREPMKLKDLVSGDDRFERGTMRGVPVYRLKSTSCGIRTRVPPGYFATPEPPPRLETAPVPLSEASTPLLPPLSHGVPPLAPPSAPLPPLARYQPLQQGLHPQQQQPQDEFDPYNLSRQGPSDDDSGLPSSSSSSNSSSLVLGPISSSDDSRYAYLTKLLREADSPLPVSIYCEWSDQRLCLIQLALLSPLEREGGGLQGQQQQGIVCLLDLVPPSLSEEGGVGGTRGTSLGEDLEEEEWEAQARALLEPLRSLLFENPLILKVFHDGREDAVYLSRLLPGLRVAPCADTQVAAALGMLAESARKASASIRGESNSPSTPLQPSLERVGLGELLQVYGIPHPAKDEVKALMTTMSFKERSSMWTSRPLPPLLVTCAADDARLLLLLWQRMTVTAAAIPLSPCSPFAGSPVSDLSLTLALSQLQVDLAINKQQEGKEGQSWLESPAVQALSSCLCTGGEVAYGMWFEMKFEDPEKGSGVSYSLMQWPGGGPGEEEEVAEGGNQASWEVDIDVAELLSYLPSTMDHDLEGPWKLKGSQTLVEVAMDDARPIVLRLRDESEVTLRHLPMVEIPLVLSSLAAKVGKPESSLFGSDGRLALPGSLHRISRIQDPRSGEIQGLTMRVGRHISGFASIFSDMLAEMVATRSGILLVGAPGLGKTTLLRDIVHTLSGTFQQSVVVVDTSNEIAGDGNPPHPCIGRARRLMVGDGDRQSSVLLEAVQNHTPKVVVIDEISNSEEVASVRTIAARGVSMVATAQVTDLSSLLSNTDLVALVGGTETVTISDKATAADTKGEGRKTRTERKVRPVFGVLIEVVSKGEWRLHRDMAASVDSMLSGGQGHAELRRYVAVEEEEEEEEGEAFARAQPRAANKVMAVSFESQHAVRLAAAASVEVTGGRKGGVGSYASVMGGEEEEGGGESSQHAESWLIDLMQASTISTAR